MRASGAVVVSALVGASVAFTLANGACTYSSTGQGGEAGALESYDGSNPFSGNSGGSDAGTTGPGSGSGGASSSSGGSPSGEDASVSPPSCATGGSCAGGICCGTTCCPSGDICCADGNSCCSCPEGETTCPDGVACCANGGVDAAPPPMQCAPEPPNFSTSCVAYYGAINQGGACETCVAGQAASCGAKQPSCSAESCEQMCDAQLACPNGCATDAYCACIAQCESPNASNMCCAPPIMSLYMCALGPCEQECTPSPDAGVR